MNGTYIDLCTHTCLSDCNLTPRPLPAAARDAGIGILALKNHNDTEDLTAHRADFPELALIQGSGITCRYHAPDGIEHELLVVALGLDPAHPRLRAVLVNNPTAVPI